MTDIVERLRRYERAFKGLPEESGWKDAAAEIDRIREALKGATVIANHASAELRAKDEEIERMRFDLASSYSAGFADAREATKRLADTFNCYAGHGREYTHEDEHTRIYAQGNKNAANTLSIMICALKEEQTR